MKHGAPIGQLFPVLGYEDISETKTLGNMGKNVPEMPNSRGNVGQK